MRKLWLLLALLTACAGLSSAQVAPSGTLSVTGGTPSNCYNANTGFTASTSCVVLPNIYGGPANVPYSVSLEQIPSGSPASVSIVTYGCMRGGTCSAALDTNTTTTQSVRSINTNQPYSLFLVVASTLSGGTNPSVLINAQASMANQLHSATNVVALFTGCSGTQYLGADGACHTAGSGTGTVTSVGLALPVGLFTVTNSPVSTTGTLTGSFASVAAHLFLGNNTGSPATAALVQPALADLTGTGNIVQNNQANTYSTGAQSFTSATSLTVPVGAGCTSAADGGLCYDSTGKLTHQRTNGADSISAAITATDTTTTHAAFASATAGILTTRAIATGDLPTGIPNANLANTATTVNAQTCTLGSTCTTVYGGESQPTGNVTWTFPSGFAQSFAATAPGTQAGAGTAGVTDFAVTQQAGGPTTGSATTAGAGASGTFNLGGAGGSGAGGTNAIGGAGGGATITAGAGGASGGTAVNSNGGSVTLTPGAAGTGGSGTAGVAGAVIIGLAGAAGNATLQWPGMAAGTGLYSPTTSSICWTSAILCSFNMVSGGVEFGNAKTVVFSQTSAGTGTGGLAFGMNGSTSTTQYLDFTVGTSTNLIKAGNACTVTADVTLSTSATNICSWTLPNVAKSWAWDCDFGWAVTAGTTPTLAIGVNASQTPTGTTNAFAEIKTTNTGTATEGSAALSASGAVGVLTSPTLTTSATVFQARASGTLLASATTGTFAVTMTGTGASFAGAAKAGSRCWLH